ncbi:uncharacterized protein I303_103185 [Kwoniella dejecticola CBS 10117]
MSGNDSDSSSCDSSCESDCVVCEDHIKKDGWHQTRDGYCKACGAIADKRQIRDDKETEYEEKCQAWEDQLDLTVLPPQTDVDTEEKAEVLTQAYKNLIEAKRDLKQAKTDKGLDDTEDTDQEDDRSYQHPHCDQ